MRKSDDEIKPGEAHVKHFQVSYRIDKILLILILISGISRVVFALGAVMVNFTYFPPKHKIANEAETLIHTFLYDFNYGAWMNLFFASMLIISVRLLWRKKIWGYRIYLWSNLLMVLLPILNLSESQMLYQFYLWILTGVWLILLRWRKGYLI